MPEWDWTVLQSHAGALVLSCQVLCSQVFYTVGLNCATKSRRLLCCDAKVIQDNCPLPCTYIFAWPPAVVIHMLDLCASLDLILQNVSQYSMFKHSCQIVLLEVSNIVASTLLRANPFKGATCVPPWVIPVLGSETTMSRGGWRRGRNFETMFTTVFNGKKVSIGCLFYGMPTKMYYIRKFLPPNSHTV